MRGGTLEVELGQLCKDLLEDQIEDGTLGIFGVCCREAGFNRMRSSFLMVLCKNRMHFIVLSSLVCGNIQTKV